MWFLIVYKVQLTAVEGVERKIIEHLRSWLQVLLQSGSTSGQLQLLCHLSLQSSKWQMQVCLHLQRFKRQQGQRSRLKTTSGQEWKDSKSLVQEKGIFKIQLYSSTLCSLGITCFQKSGKVSLNKEENHDPGRNEKYGGVPEEVKSSQAYLPGLRGNVGQSTPRGRWLGVMVQESGCVFPCFHWVPPLGGALIHTPVMLICLWSRIISHQYLRPAHSTFLHQFVSWSTLVLGLLCILWFLLFMLTYPVLLVFLVASRIHHTPHSHFFSLTWTLVISGNANHSLSSVWTLTCPVLLFPSHPPLASKRPLFKFHATHDSWPSFEFHVPPTIPVCTVFTWV